MKARDFDKKFVAGKDIAKDIDWSKARRPNTGTKRVNVDFPAWSLRNSTNRLSILA